MWLYSGTALQSSQINMIAIAITIGENTECLVKQRRKELKDF